MKISLKIFLLLLFTTSFIDAQAIDIVKELKELNKHYLELDEFQLNFDIEYLDNTGNTLMKRSGEVVHSKKIHFIDLSGDITLINENQYLSLNKEFETIIYSEWDKVNKPVSQVEDLTQMIDSLWQNKNDIEFEILSLSQNKLRVSINEKSNPSISGYELLVDINANKLIEFKYKIKETDPFSKNLVNEVIIRYTNESPKVKLRDSKYKIAHYLVHKGNELMPTSLYVGYQIISQSQIIKEHE